MLAVALSLSFACSIPDDRFHPTSDAPTGPPDDAASCQQGARRCDDNSVTECQGGSWTPIRVCDDLCSTGGCVTPPSCSGGVAVCGSGSDTCCRSLPVPGGMFSRSYDGVSAGFTDDRFHATVTRFSLDKYEVPVARFQKFVDAYPGSKPAVGTGKNPRDSTDPGWRTEWTALLPAATSDLQAMLVCGGVTTQQAQLPVRCVTWSVAQAFCIWDNGRLPTEAEWNLVASGAEQQRVYPWSSPPPSTAIGAANAAFGGQPGPSIPGGHAAGDGRWGHSDLGGNLNEWVFDNFVSPYPTETCTDCANHTAAAMHGVRGGSYASVAQVLLSSFRSGFPTGSRSETVGFRCARDPAP